MAVPKSDEYQHNNPDRAFVDGKFVRGAKRKVADREELYGLVIKADQLEQDVTVVRIKADGENGGVTTEVLLVDDTAIDSAAGWELYRSGSSAPGNGSGGGALVETEFSILVQQDGAQYFDMPAGVDGVLSLGVLTTYGVPRHIMDSNWGTSAGRLIFGAGASLKDGEIIEGRYYTGGGGSGGTGATRDLLDLTAGFMDSVMALSYVGCDADPAASPAGSYPGQQFDAVGSDGKNRTYYCSRGTYVPGNSTTGVGPAWHRIEKLG
jgi:hypothetical protein